MFTDIHWGARNNSDQHNNDCMNYIDWFCENVHKDPDIDHVVFMGDWHENRSALNVSTLKSSYHGAKKLNDLGLPVFFHVGNHDLYYRHTRDIHSVFHLSSFENFRIIDDPIVSEETIIPTLFCPYMFHEEYTELANYLKVPVWYGHFEFQGFIVTGYNNIMPSGPNSNDFKGPKQIFSGHFHKRQHFENVTYIGNTFPTNFGDAGDASRGMATYDYITNRVEFKDWDQCPKFIKTTISALIDGKIQIPTESRVKCSADITLTYEEINVIRQSFLDKYKLREMVIEESEEIENVISGTEVDVSVTDGELLSVSEMMLQLLNNIDTEHINNEMLIDIYKSLKV